MHMLRRLLAVCYSLSMLASHFVVTSYLHSNILPQTGNIVTFIFKLRATYHIVIQLLMLIQADVFSSGTTGTITQWSISAQGSHLKAYIIQLLFIYSKHLSIYTCACTAFLCFIHLLLPQSWSIEYLKKDFDLSSSLLSFSIRVILTGLGSFLGV